ncbi:unnamed protein product, partial [Allacma fusca]
FWDRINRIILTKKKGIMGEIERRSLSLHDPNSFSNPEEIKIVHTHVDWKVDFSRQIVSGSATYDLVAATPNEKKIIFDVHTLGIHSIKDADGTVLEYELGDSFMTVGQPLTVKIPKLEDLKLV